MKHKGCLEQIKIKFEAKKTHVLLLKGIKMFIYKLFDPLNRQVLIKHKNTNVLASFRLHDLLSDQQYCNRSLYAALT